MIALVAETTRGASCKDLDSSPLFKITAAFSTPSTEHGVSDLRKS